MEVRKVTKAVLSCLAAVISFINIPPVYDVTVQGVRMLAKHPHGSTIGAGVVVALALLHDPRVREGLGIKITSAEVVSLASSNETSTQ